MARQLKTILVVLILGLVFVGPAQCALSVMLLDQGTQGTKDIEIKSTPEQPKASVTRNNNKPNKDKVRRKLEELLSTPLRKLKLNDEERKLQTTLCELLKSFGKNNRLMKKAAIKFFVFFIKNKDKKGEKGDQREKGKKFIEMMKEFVTAHKKARKLRKKKDAESIAERCNNTVKANMGLANIANLLKRNEVQSGEDKDTNLPEKASRVSLYHSLNEARELFKDFEERYKVLKIKAEDKRTDPEMNNRMVHLEKTLGFLRIYLTASEKLLEDGGKEKRKLSTITENNKSLADDNAETMLRKLKGSFERLTAAEKQIEDLEYDEAPENRKELEKEVEKLADDEYEQEQKDDEAPLVIAEKPTTCETANTKLLLNYRGVK